MWCRHASNSDMIYFVAKLFEQLLLYTIFFPDDTSNVLIIYLRSYDAHCYLLNLTNNILKAAESLKVMPLCWPFLCVLTLAFSVCSFILTVVLKNIICPSWHVNMYSNIIISCRTPWFQKWSCQQMILDALMRYWP